MIIRIKAGKLAGGGGGGGGEKIVSYWFQNVPGEQICKTMQASMLWHLRSSSFRSMEPAEVILRNGNLQSNAHNLRTVWCILIL